AVLVAGVWVLDTFFLHYTTGFNGSVPLWIRLLLGALYWLYRAIWCKRGCLSCSARSGRHRA
ncbi:MAG: hypothetical protein PHY29_06530, partial [Syntrophales bacterium]|nr:hypothetical protein [Syntrophales bacterium]